MPLSYLKRPLFLLLILHMGVLVLLHSRGFFEPRPSPALKFLGSYSDVEAEGTVVSGVTLNLIGERFVLSGSRLAGLPASEEILVYLPKGGTRSPEPRPGQRIRLEGRVRRGRPARNPGEFDERAFLDDRGIAWVMRVRRLAIIQDTPWLGRPRAWAEAAHRSMENRFGRLLSRDSARIMDGITMGYKGPLNRALNRAVQDAGAMHVLVPSGATVVAVFAAVSAAAGLLGLSPGLRWVAAALAAGFYVMMVGAAPPYTRAYLQSMLMGAGFLRDRQSGAFQAMVLAALITLAVSPRAVFDVGFQMTYLASFGLLLGLPGLQAALPSRPSWAKRAAQAGAVSAIVTLMLWPIFAEVFRRGSLAGVAANLILVPFAEGLMAAGFALWSWSFIPGGPGLSSAARGLEAGVQAWAWLCRKFAALPMAAMPLVPMSLSQTAIFYLLALAALVWPRRRASLVLVVLAAAIGATRAMAARLHPRLHMVLLHIPQRQNVPLGQAAILTWPDGRHWLALSGKASTAGAKALKALGIAAVDRRVEAREGRPEKICHGSICLEIGGEGGPRVLRGEAEYSIIPLRLRRSAVEVTTDGSTVQIIEAP